MMLRNPFPKICIALGFPEPDKLLKHARSEAEAGETFLEFRLDHLQRPEQGAQVISEFLSKNPETMVLATCRRHQNHGKFNGSIDDQLRVLDQAVIAGASAVDVEIETAETVKDRLSMFRGRARLVVSYHNFDGTPQMDPVMRRMLAVPAEAYKIVTTARKPSDNSRLLALSKANPRVPLILLSMGEIGFPTRVLSSAAGSVFTYAAPSAAEGTAPGQARARQLRHVYHVDKLSKAAKVYGVVADPVRHSISPAVHNRAFQARRLDCVYLPFLVAPAHLKDFFVFAEAAPVAGFSVTIPHKQRVMRFLDVVDPLARRIGAVNTVWRKAGKWRGTNTDAAGVSVPLARRIRLQKSSVLVAGNGGAARGAIFALLDAGAKVFLTGRNPDRVRALAKASGATAVMRKQAEAEHYDALVHATPLGMAPHVNDCFFENNIPADVVFDMVYNPAETELLRRARELGRTLVPGIEMFVEQAVRQFEIWTEETPPRAAMEKAAHEALDKSGNGNH